MSGELHAYGTSGSTVYALVLNASGKVESGRGDRSKP